CFAYGLSVVSCFRSMKKLWSSIEKKGWRKKKTNGMGKKSLTLPCICSPTHWQLPVAEGRVLTYRWTPPTSNCHPTEPLALMEVVLLYHTKLRLSPVKSTIPPLLLRKVEIRFKALKLQLTLLRSPPRGNLLVPPARLGCICVLAQLPLKEKRNFRDTFTTHTIIRMLELDKGYFIIYPQANSLGTRVELLNIDLYIMADTGCISTTKRVPTQSGRSHHCTAVCA
ncbi:hypothetical protein JOB18_028725, partial [Solea senegalensis]